ncbi:hypothetical protein BCR42DRAFT_420322 [Absidia repens]|uniref:Dynein axonemal assembly factor 5 TPR repeats domain-containing protein n=1 Tax=Absidia repens TaxID=90262 RepID=A0A1X2I9Q6_9FUNG|nr:hypothetical protein BCR42DRAFT_420322 [Absidia repens]
MHQVLLCSSQGTIPLSDVFPKLIHDQSASVRASLFAYVGDTLVHWAPVNRYSYADRLLPVLFAGVVDELDSISETSREKLDQLGKTCSQDLVEAGIVNHVDATDEVDTGLKHVVHLCYDASIKRLLSESNDFIANKKATSLAALNEFLVYVSADDLVRSNKWVIQRLMMIMAGPATTTAISISVDPSVQQQIDKVVCAIGRLLSWPILLDQLLPRLSKTNLLAESSHLPASTTVLVIFDILLILSRDNDTLRPLESLTDHDRQRIKTTFKAPYLAPYMKPAEITTLETSF